PGIVVIASGPATWSPLARAIHAVAGAEYRFSFIGRPPLIATESVDLTEARWEATYPGAEPSLFLPLTESEARELVDRLAEAQRNEPPGLDANIVLADESRTVERLAADPGDRLRRVLSGPRGPDTTIEAPALCLEPDDADRSAYHLGGFFTSLSAEAQRDALRALRGFSEVKLIRPGMVQRTPWLAGHEAIMANLQLRRSNPVFVAGTLTGFFGYTEALVLGAVAGIGAARLAGGTEPLPPPVECLAGALCHALAEHEPHPDGRMLQANFGMIPEHRQDQDVEKNERRQRQETRALDAIKRYAGAD
ncbi:MAG: FAD-dependent oxidoreductase, partial [Armatimonadota bacterium]